MASFPDYMRWDDTGAQCMGSEYLAGVVPQRWADVRRRLKCPLTRSSSVVEWITTNDTIHEDDDFLIPAEQIMASLENFAARSFACARFLNFFIDVVLPEMRRFYPTSETRGEKRRRTWREYDDDL
jgi:hypothetical protein